MTEFTSRLAVSADVPKLTVLMDAAIAELQRAFLDDAQIASSRAIMGIDSQLIDDGTYFVVESGGDIAGCGGWSRRATLYGGNQTPGRDGHLLDPAVDPARVRAMYTDPAYARRGVGHVILSLCEAAAAAEGFRRLELMSTLAGEPLYTAYGFRPLERLADATGGAAVPLVRMEKPVNPSLLGVMRGDPSIGRAAEESGLSVWELLDATRVAGVGHPLGADDAKRRLELFAGGTPDTLPDSR